MEESSLVPNFSNKNIYSFINEKGEKVFVDPYEVIVKFDEAMELEDKKTVLSWVFPDKKFEEWTDDDHSLWMKGVYRIAPAIAKAFNLSLLDPRTGEGYTREQLINIYGDFNSWMADLKKSTD